MPDLESRIAELPEAKRHAEELVELLSGSELVAHAEGILAALDLAETVEVESDLDANLEEAARGIHTLLGALRTARRSGALPAEVANGASREVRALLREIAEVR